MDVTIVGIPFNGDGTRPEAENPARALRDGGLAARLITGGHRVRDLGDVEVPHFDGRREPRTGVLNADAWRSITATAADVLGARVGPPGFLLVLGGDCAVMSAVCLAMRRAGRALGIVYVDGHADARLPDDSPSGEPADLVLTALTGRIPGLFDDTGGGSPLASDDDLVVIGYRDPDRIAEFGIAAYPRHHVERRGVRRTVDEAIARFAHRGHPVWLHFDVDVLDPSIMPAVLFPEWDGLDGDTATAILKQVIAAAPVLGMSITCYHPQLDPDGTAAARVIDIVGGAMAPQSSRTV